MCKKKDKIQTPKKRKEYSKTGKIDVALCHLDYLNSLYASEKDRQTTIENKNSQLVGQAGIIVSIIALTIPLLFNILNSLSLVSQVLFVITYVGILINYLLTIMFSIRTLQINKYKYPGKTTSTILNSKHTQKIDFVNDDIVDLIYIVDNSIETNNKKGTNLIRATICFRLATISLVLFAILMIIFSLSNNNERPKQLEVDGEIPHISLLKTDSTVIIKYQPKYNASKIGQSEK